MLCANGSAEVSALTVFDYKSDTLYARGAAPLCGWKLVMYHNPATGRLYFRWGGGLEGSGMGVIDEQTNRVVKQVHLPGCNRGLTYSRTSNKFYFQGEYGSFFERRGLGVMDGSKDSLLGVIEMGDNYGNSFPCWCPDGDKVYCFAEAGARWYIAVTDCSTDSVVRTIDVYDAVKEFQYLGNSRMLCNLRERVMLIDSQTDSVLVDSTTIGAVFALAHTGDGEKVYMVRRNPGRLEVRSSSSLSLLATIDWPYFDRRGTFLAYSDTTRKLYWLVDDSVLAIDATGDTVTARMGTSAPYSCACLDHTGRYMFWSSSATGRDSCLVVYDTQSDSLVAAYLHLPPIASITASPEQRCLYVGSRDLILVYPDAPPGVEETPNGEVRATKSGPTVVKGTLVLDELGTRSELPGRNSVMSRAVLLDASGRKVLELHPGANDVRGLAPGVYFVRRQGSRGRGSEDSRVTKVVVMR